MVEKRGDKAMMRQKPNIRDQIDGVKFRQLAPGITTHPLVRSGRPCIEGTGIKVADIVAAQKYHGLDAGEVADHYELDRSMVANALAFYAAHTEYIDTDLEIDGLNDSQLAEAQYGTRPDSILSRRTSIS